MKCLIACPILWILFFPACADIGVEPPPLAVADDIREAVLRYMFADNVEVEYGIMSTYFISFCSVNRTQYAFRDIHDPPAEFIQRFRGYRIPVKVGSRCTSLPGRQPIDPETGGDALYFLVGDIVVLNHNQVEVYAGNTGQLNVFRLNRSGHQWIVDRKGYVWIS